MDAMSFLPMIIGLVVTLVVVGVSIFTMVKVFGGLGKSSAERDRLLREGIQTAGRLLAVQMGGMTMTVGVHRHLQLQLQVEVQMQGRPPYQAMLTTMVSELQISQLQPGAMLTLRVDPRDSNKMALEGVGAPMPQQHAPAYGAPGMGAPSPYGAPPMGAPGFAQVGVPSPYNPMSFGMQQPGMIGIGGAPKLPASAKLGLWIGIGSAVFAMVVVVIVVLVNVGGVGLGSATEGDGTCAQAARCCEVITAGGASAANCKNLGKIGVPASACEQSLESFREMAKAQGRTCR